MLLVALCGSSTAASFSGPLADFAERWLGELTRDKAAAFVSKCTVEEKGYWAALLLPTGRNDGLLIEVREGSVVNLAKVEVTAQGLALGDTQGGEYSRDRALRLIDDLAMTGLILNQPFERTKLEPSDKTRTCIVKPPLG